jgi:hypothetical protein
MKFLKEKIEKWKEVEKLKKKYLKHNLKLLVKRKEIIKVQLNN